MQTEVRDTVLVQEVEAEGDVAGRANRVEAVPAEAVADSRCQRLLGQFHDDVKLAVDRRHAVHFHEAWIRQFAPVGKSTTRIDRSEEFL